MKRKQTERRRNSVLMSLCALVSLCVYGYDWL